MYKYILFDADNTLFDFDKAQLISFKSVLSKYGLTFSNELYSLYIETNHYYWNLFEQGAIDKQTVQKERFSVFFKKAGMVIDGYNANCVYQDSLSSQSWLLPNAEKICSILCTHFPLVIVTNGVGETQRKRIKNSLIDKYIFCSIVSEDIGYAKPDPRFFEQTFRILGCQKDDEILIVGDSIETDIKGGIKSGIKSGIYTCWYNPHNQKVPDHLKINHIITDLIQLTGICGMH